LGVSADVPNICGESRIGGLSDGLSTVYVPVASNFSWTGKIIGVWLVRILKNNHVRISAADNELRTIKIEKKE
jgi:hypothetical protein